MKTAVLTVLFCTACTLYAQDSLQQQATKPAPADTSVWKHSLILSANVTQVSFSDWAQGGENSLAYGLFAEGKSIYAPEPINWEIHYKFGYGQAKLGSQAIRKTDDQIDVGTVLTYKLGAIINPYASASLLTQFAKGFTYDAAGVATPVSNYFDPAYLTQAVGVGYQPAPEVKTRLGAALREILTKVYTQYSDDPATTSEKEKTRIEGGAESVTEVGWEFAQNIVLNAKLNVFVPVKNTHLTVIRSDNTLSAKVNKFLAVNLNVLLINDPQVQLRTQAKQTLALGFSYTLL